MCLSAILGVGSALIGSGSANRAARSQERAANDQIALERESRDLAIQRVQPFLDAGRLGQNALLFNLGLGERPVVGGNALRVEEVPAGRGGFATTGMGDMRETQFRPGTPASFRVGDRTFGTRDEAQAYADANSTPGTPYAGFQETPGYRFAFDQGTAAVNAMAGARGGLVSGRTMQDLTSFGQGMANQEFGNYLNRLAGLTDQGLSAASLQNASSANATAGISNAIGARGNAQAAGAIGVGNALMGGLQNGIGIWNYQRNLTPSATGSNWLFGGNSWG